MLDFPLPVKSLLKTGKIYEGIKIGIIARHATPNYLLNVGGFARGA